MSQVNYRNQTSPYLSGQLLSLLEEAQLRHSEFKINAITSPSSITLPIPNASTPHPIDGLDPVRQVQLWPEADNRTSPRLDIRLHDITLELEAEG